MNMFLFILLITLSTANAILVPLDVQSEECYLTEPMNQMDKLAISFDVVEGGFRDIDFGLYSPDGELIYEQKGKDSDRIVYSAVKPGDYRFCFTNHWNSRTMKLIKMKVEVEPSNKKEVDGKAPDSTDPDHSSVSKLLRSLAHQLMGVKYESERLNWMMTEHIRLTRNTKNLMLYWSIFESVFAMIAVFWQVKYFCHLFEVVRLY